MDLCGVGHDRLHLEWLSSAEARRFADLATSVTQTIRDLGTFDAARHARSLTAAEMTLTGEPVRWLVGKEVRIVAQGDAYGRKWDTAEYEAVLDNTLEREYHKNLIYLAIREGHTSVRAIAEAVNLPVARVSYLLADLEKTNRVEFKAMHERVPEFAVI